MMRLLWGLGLAVGCAGDEVSTEPATFTVRLENISALGDLVPQSTGVGQDHVFAPGVAVLHDDGWSLFEEGTPAEPGLEALAEDGDNSGLIASLEGSVGRVVSFAATDDVTYADAPMLPGDSAQVDVEAKPGERLTIALMYGVSNDVFVALPPGGVPLFDAAGEPAPADLTGSLQWFDAGTELNQEPGTGSDQPERQSAPNTGDGEDGVVALIVGSDTAGFAYPQASQVLRLSVELH